MNAMSSVCSHEIPVTTTVRNVPKNRKHVKSLKAIKTSKEVKTVNLKNGKPISSSKSTAIIPSTPYSVVITGSTKGIGKELARVFLKNGDKVMITSRNEGNVNDTIEELSEEYGNDNVNGVSCNVTKSNELKDMADYAIEKMGTVDIWINNAGSNAYNFDMLLNFTENELREIVETNMLGLMLGCKEAIRVMQYQRTNGHIFNMDGAGSNGRPTPRYAAYGATKRSIVQFNSSLREELKMQSINNIGVHVLSPGMCTTDLLMVGANTPQARFFINCLAEPPIVPAEYLVPLVRQVPLENSKSGIPSKNLEFLNPPKAFYQIFKRLILKERKDRFVQEEEEK